MKTLFGKSSLFPLLAVILLAAPFQPAHAENVTVRLRNAMNTDPASGIAATKDYLAKNPNYTISGRASLERLVALTYLTKLNDAEGGLAFLDTSMAEVDKAKPGAAQDLARVILLNARSRIYTEQRKYQEAVDLVDKNLPVMLKVNSFTFLDGLTIYGKALDQLKQGQKMIPVIQKALVAYPELMANSWVIGQLVNNMVAQGNGPAALGYAKLSWMVCPFDTKSISTATNLLTSTWFAIDLNAGKGNAFLAAQKDSTTPNPLTDIKLPAVDKTALDTALADLPATEPRSHPKTPHVFPKLLDFHFEVEINVLETVNIAAVGVNQIASARAPRNI